MAEPDFQQIRHHAALFDTQRQAVIGTTLEGGIVYWNSTAERIFGWSEREVQGRSILEVTPAETTREQAMAIMERLREGRSWSGEFLLRNRNGQEFSAWVRDVPVQDALGELIGIVGITSRL